MRTGFHPGVPSDQTRSVHGSPHTQSTQTPPPLFLFSSDRSVDTFVQCYGTIMILIIVSPHRRSVLRHNDDTDHRIPTSTELQDSAISMKSKESSSSQLPIQSQPIMRHSTSSWNVSFSIVFPHQHDIGSEKDRIRNPHITKRHKDASGYIAVIHVALNSELAISFLSEVLSVPYHFLRGSGFVVARRSARAARRSLSVVVGRCRSRSEGAVPYNRSSGCTRLVRSVVR